MACSRSIRPTSRAMGLTTDRYPMCSFGSIYSEFFTLMAPSGMAGELQWLGSLRCSELGTLAHSWHLKVQGRTAPGENHHAVLAERHPRYLNAWLLMMSLFETATWHNANVLA